MRATLRTILTCAALSPAPLAMGQGPDRGGPITAGGAAARLMQFDADKDGKLTRVELTDERLGRLFDRLDADKDGIVSKTEAASLTAEDSAPRRGPAGPGGPGGPPGRGFGRPGEVMPGMLRQHLNVTSDQAEKLDELQRDVDARIAKILTSEQASELKQMQERGPGGPPGRGGPPGGGRRRGGPPDGGPPGGGLPDDGPPRRNGPPND